MGLYAQLKPEAAAWTKLDKQMKQRKRIEPENSRHGCKRRATKVRRRGRRVDKGAAEGVILDRVVEGNTLKVANQAR